MRKKSQQERQEEESILEVYLHALGMLDENLPTRRASHGSSGVGDWLRTSMIEIYRALSAKRALFVIPKDELQTAMLRQRASAVGQKEKCRPFR